MQRIIYEHCPRGLCVVTMSQKPVNPLQCAYGLLVFGECSKQLSNISRNSSSPAIAFFTACITSSVSFLYSSFFIFGNLLNLFSHTPINPEHHPQLIFGRPRRQHKQKRQRANEPGKDIKQIPGQAQGYGIKYRRGHYNCFSHNSNSVSCLPSGLFGSGSLM